MIYVGIDNGNDGGIAALNERGEILLKVAMPKVVAPKKGFLANDRAICRIMKQLVKQDDVTVCLEEYIFAKQANTLSKMADCFAVIRTTTHLLGLPFTQVHPKIWQKVFWTKPKSDAEWTTKKAALAAAKELWPKAYFRATDKSTTPHDGIVDALLIAEYHRRQNDGGTNVSTTTGAESQA